MNKESFKIGNRPEVFHRTVDALTRAVQDEKLGAIHTSCAVGIILRNVKAGFLYNYQESEHPSWLKSGYTVEELRNIEKAYEGWGRWHSLDWDYPKGLRTVFEYLCEIHEVEIEPSLLYRDLDMSYMEGKDRLELPA